MPRRQPWVSAVLAAVVVLSFGHAHAAPCAGFTDVDSQSAFCRSVEWVRNRGVTLGCGGTLYCPDAPVLRLSMAAFIARLGLALTPQQVQIERSSGFVFLDTPSVLCESGGMPVTNFPRRASVDINFAALASNDVDVASAIVMSTDAGVTWTPINSLINRKTVVGSRWDSFSDLGTIDLDAGTTVRWGLKVYRAVGLVGNLTESRCEMRITLRTREGASSPY